MNIRKFFISRFFCFLPVAIFTPIFCHGKNVEDLINSKDDSVRWVTFFSQFDELIKNAIRFSVTEVFSVFDEEGVPRIMTESDNAFWSDPKNGMYQDFTLVNYRDVSWGTGSPGGSFFHHSDRENLVSIPHAISEFDFSNLNLNKTPLFFRSPVVTIRNPSRLSDSPLNFLLFNSFNSPIWNRDFRIATNANKDEKVRFYDKRRTLFFELDANTQLPALIGQVLRDENNNVIGVHRTVKLEDFIAVNGFLIPRHISVTFYDLENGYPKQQTQYFIRPYTIEIGHNVPPLFSRDSLIPLGARVVNEITNETYIHYGSVEGGDAADAVGDYLRGLLDD